VTGRGGGGTHMNYWEEPRALTNRERDCKRFLTIIYSWAQKRAYASKLEWRFRVMAHELFLKPSLWRLGT